MAALIILLLISLFFALPISAPLWQYTLLPKLVQFPWRFLALTAFAVAAIAGNLSKKLALVLTGLVIVSAAPLLTVERTFKTDDYFSTNDDSTTVKNEYRSIWLNTDIKNKPDQQIVPLSPTRIRINKAYFPGMKAYIDEVETPIDYQTNGLVELNVSSSFQRITTKFGETPVRLFADGLSVLGFSIILILEFLKIAGRKRHP